MFLSTPQASQTSKRTSSCDDVVIAGLKGRPGDEGSPGLLGRQGKEGLPGLPGLKGMCASMHDVTHALVQCLLC